MSKSTTEIQLTPHTRITLAGYRIRVHHENNQFRVSLLGPTGEAFCTANVPRSGSLSATQALDKAYKNTWGKSSGFYKVLVDYADIAERLATIDEVPALYQAIEGRYASN